MDGPLFRFPFLTRFSVREGEGKCCCWDFGGKTKGGGGKRKRKREGRKRDSASGGKRKRQLGIVSEVSELEKQVLVYWRKGRKVSLKQNKFGDKKSTQCTISDTLVPV